MDKIILNDSTEITISSINIEQGNLIIGIVASEIELADLKTLFKDTFSTKIIKYYKESTLINTFEDINSYPILESIRIEDVDGVETYFVVLVKDTSVDTQVEYLTNELKKIKESAVEKEIADMTVDELKEYKKQEVNAATDETIYDGFNCELSVGTQHFSLTTEDQLNLIGISILMQQGVTQFPYHCDGGKCGFYNLEDATIICNSAITHRMYNTTYCNALHLYINNCTTKDELLTIAFGMELPDEYDEILVSITGKSSKSE